ncbi:MAG: BON domain-containing protein [Deltaproteobacteria bacterium]|nr:BON domain-containing protein [Deltaproteobacteria bacterium]
MYVKKTLATLALASSLIFTGWIPRAFAQSNVSRSTRELTTPNNDAGSGGNRAPGTKISGPYQAANTVPGIDKPSDASITKAVRYMLTSDAETRNSNIEVTTNDGMVILHGRAKSLTQAKRAEALVSKVNGVKGVEDQLDYHTTAEHM